MLIQAFAAQRKSINNDLIRTYHFYENLTHKDYVGLKKAFEELLQKAEEQLVGDFCLKANNLESRAHDSK